MFIKILEKLESVDDTLFYKYLKGYKLNIGQRKS